MYAKFVIYDEESVFYNELGISEKDGSTGPDMVVPYENGMIEGKRMSYRKIRVRNRNEYYKIISHLGCHTMLTGMPFDIEGQEDLNKPFEFILLSVYEGAENPPESYITAADSVLFIMNDNGKTIDKLACRNNH